MFDLLIVLARTFPFWAAPLGVSFMGAAIVLIKKKHTTEALIVGSLGAALLAGVFFYFYYEGWANFVQWLYDNVINPE